MTPRTVTTAPAPPRRSPLLAALLLGAVAAPAAWAQETPYAEEHEPRSRFSFLGEAGVNYQFDTDIDGPGEAEFSVLRYDVGLAVSTDLTNELRWVNSFFAGIADYDFSGGGFAADDPWETVVLLRYGTQLVYQLNDRWGLRGGGVFMFSRETDADWSTSFMGGGTAGVDYRVSDRLFLTAGLGVTSQIEDDPQVVPALGFFWRASEDWAVRVGAVPVSGGALAGGEVEYSFNEAIALGLGVQWQQRRFRLDDEGVAPDGVGEDKSLPLRLRLGWRCLPNVSVHLLAGVALAGELELSDRDGNELRKEDYDPAPYLGLRVLGRF